MQQYEEFSQRSVAKQWYWYNMMYFALLCHTFSGSVFHRKLLEQMASNGMNNTTGKHVV